MQMNQSRDHAPTTSFIGFPQGSYTVYLPVTPKARYHTTKENPYAQEPTEIIYAQPAYPALLLPLSEITIKAPAHVCPSLPLPPDCPGSSRMPPDLGSCEGNKLTLQWQSPPDLLTSPHLNNNKSYTFKHSDHL